MDEAYPSPEQAAKGSDPDCRVVAVEYSPDGGRAIVFLEYSPDSRPTPYEVLCEKGAGGWSSEIGSSGGSGWNWKFTHEDPTGGELGVTTRWDPPRAEWGTPPPPSPATPEDAEPW